MNAFKSTAVALVLASAFTSSQACDRDKAAAAPAARPSLLVTALDQVRAEHRARLARSTREALVALRSEAASAVAAGDAVGGSPSVRTGI